jgi:osmoprotectant transport system substrate-binding protein
MRRRLLLAALAAPLAAPALARAAPLLRMGSKNFTEQLVVAELFAQGLERAGATVQRRLNLGGTAIAHQSLLSGEIDLYPEYTGTGLGVVLKQPPEGDAATILAKVRAATPRSASTGSTPPASTTAMPCSSCRRRRGATASPPSPTSPAPRPA